MSAQVEFRPRSRVKPESAYLSAFARDVTSQHGEDGIIEKVFQVIGPKNRVCMEIGAHDGKLLSNTWNLVVNQGWRGILIEGQAHLFDQMRARFAPGNAGPEGRCGERVTLVRRYAGFEADNTLDALLAAAGAPRDLDLVSIDIDSNDWYLWEGLKVHRPRLLVIEFNATIPNDVYFVQARDFGVNQGCSLLALIELGRKKGYELVATTPANAFFVPAELFPAFGIADNDIDSMYHFPHLLTRLFQGYDGEILLAGYQNLHWPNVPFTAEDIQPLPRRLRRYGTVFVDSLSGMRVEFEAERKG